VRGVNPLIAEGNGCLAQPLPSVPQVVREVLRQGRFGGRPTVVLFSVLDPLLAVVALSTCHTPILVAIVDKLALPTCIPTVIDRSCGC